MPHRGLVAARPAPFVLLAAAATGALVCLWALRRRVLPIAISGRSMEPTLLSGELVLAERVTSVFVSPRRGDIVALDIGNKPPTPWSMDRWRRTLGWDVSRRPPLLVKRVVGLPGELVEVRSGVLWIDREPLVERYLTPASLRAMGQQPSGPEVVLGPRAYYVLGDNRAATGDSRSIGPVRADQVVALARAVVSPKVRWLK